MDKNITKYCWDLRVLVYLSVPLLNGASFKGNHDKSLYTNRQLEHWKFFFGTMNLKSRKIIVIKCVMRKMTIPDEMLQRIANQNIPKNGENLYTYYEIYVSNAILILKVWDILKLMSDDNYVEN